MDSQLIMGAMKTVVDCIPMEIMIELEVLEVSAQLKLNHRGFARISAAMAALRSALSGYDIFGIFAHRIIKFLIKRTSINQDEIPSS